MEIVELKEISNSLKIAFETGDIDKINELYHDDIIVWHNYDLLNRNKNNSLETAKWVFKNIQNFKIEIIDIIYFEQGYIQQCIFRGKNSETGEFFVVHALIKITCSDNKIIKIEEYTDPKQGASVPEEY